MISTKKIHPSDKMPVFQTWQDELSAVVDNIDELFALLELPAPPKTQPSSKKFPLRVPHAFINKMQKGNPNDPLLLQVLPDTKEALSVQGYSTDPLAENHHNPTKGILHKYDSRVLITVTGSCAIHCRYCFRQHFDYAGNQPNTQQIDEILAYINKNSQINEVILSGGDPLNLSNKRLKLWLDKLSTINHLHTIRLHTRLPVVLPNRIDNELIELLKSQSKSIVLVLHINHPNEIDTSLSDKCHALKAAGITLLNQTVLLKNINDNADTLAQLSHALFAAGILPYYLHILDKVAGAAHFDLPIEQAVAIYWQLLERLSGYLVPKLVQELPNRPFKTPIDIYQFDQMAKNTKSS
ncbi:L-lysine 2,3-aminomutase [Moraxella cuniculi DSM 21768]|uniref:L-lysine 2,3-aminomutase n=1 Tax=Moraxella cuniculi DSM 21768 TaxID=1122245 RepID=A0A1N7D727_9GAMM|nr:EF-P beta-lysylation protein EpmB [Moraxella cuniculi]OOS07874.1 EF-P beta-lysylation protein EpmB [Moraxella cuniculi]SIR71660.1 L-lysine 2,3-aminomutase [Moraxella cuniculi DSM 21768]